jgi:hypothetical protein
MYSSDLFVAIVLIRIITQHNDIAKFRSTYATYMEIVSIKEHEFKQNQLFLERRW